MELVFAILMLWQNAPIVFIVLAVILLLCFRWLFREVLFPISWIVGGTIWFGFKVGMLALDRGVTRIVSACLHARASR
jgi:hypothetical protein